MNYSKESVWYSGDWKNRGNHDHIPYNGIKISTTANYATSSSSVQKLVSVAVEVIDYTYDILGVSSKIAPLKPGIWTDIPIPMNNETLPPELNSEFTIIGTDNIGLGKLKLEVMKGGMFLNIKFRYGITGKKRDEIGYILHIEETITI
ncbi:hypothetical protein [Flavobacterium hercynium]|uniref:Uncharacterized protein n=1 Tax=Flavobacterium hercynium TaxID=387094 RepID=A0A226H0U4_9FLAO|nr:hypothetical protein [Flavobacterium hercynium]OXA87296.1 hypothetical protein B0A66_16930 [Flavobacterium hercynium]SMP19764.1 hypothetical protein SAMN06265346_10669 [Flavobacterium hercynium]